MGWIMDAPLWKHVSVEIAHVRVGISSDGCTEPCGTTGGVGKHPQPTPRHLNCVLPSHPLHPPPGPDNDLLRLNSGLYFVRSEPSSLSAMSAIVVHAAGSQSTEQPSFYAVLCGERGQFRAGNTTCRPPGWNLTVQFLDRNR